MITQYTQNFSGDFGFVVETGKLGGTELFWNTGVKRKGGGGVKSVSRSIVYGNFLLDIFPEIFQWE